VPSQDPVRAFFDTRSYLTRNAIIPVRARIVAQMLAGVRGSRVLDLGCGDGSISRSLIEAQNQLTLVDFSSKMLTSARGAFPAGAPVEFIQADILEFVPTEPYDAVICVGVLAHVDSVEQAITRGSAAVRPGGLCVLQTTDNGSPPGRLLNKYYRWRRRAGYALNSISLAELVCIADLHGLQYQEFRRYGLLWPGLGRLPHRWERRMEEVVGSSPRLSRLGCEVMVSFQKREPVLS
jgi:2-polyprenyl-3-methyl-5-hydroxy-6-metoxy-1,4-benzoquinol methylase